MTQIVDELMQVIEDVMMDADVDYPAGYDEVSRAKCRLLQQINAVPTRDLTQQHRDIRTLIHAAPPAVAVKALVWRKTIYGTSEAYSLVGVYRLNHTGNGRWSVVVKSEVLRDSDGRKNFATLEAAEAAAQADYEARIRSALATPADTSPKPVIPEGWRDISTAPKDGTWILAVLAGYIPETCFWDGDEWLFDEGQDPATHYHPTHWMPLPAAPRDASHD